LKPVAGLHDSELRLFAYRTGTRPNSDSFVSIVTRRGTYEIL
jgi:hypothetical protein